MKNFQLKPSSVLVLAFVVVVILGYIFKNRASAGASGSFTPGMGDSSDSEF